MPSSKFNQINWSSRCNYTMPMFISIFISLTLPSSTLQKRKPTLIDSLWRWIILKCWLFLLWLKNVIFISCGISIGWCIFTWTPSKSEWRRRSILWFIIFYLEQVLKKQISMKIKKTFQISIYRLFWMKSTFKHGTGPTAGLRDWMEWAWDWKDMKFRMNF